MSQGTMVLYLAKDEAKDAFKRTLEGCDERAGMGNECFA